MFLDSIHFMHEIAECLGDNSQYSLFNVWKSNEYSLTFYEDIMD